ncbi:lytic murein transglycosylase B [Reichenbachiella versicolor]|uniref:lytic murein transglycosylase B n=1 Tax=Reichenbachiella versicolor TaxID=1821036 RepID=UPI000D6DFDA7|nr:lytic murein transglycosylase B [Reichenbachiella versicolor]
MNYFRIVLLLTLTIWSQQNCFAQVDQEKVDEFTRNYAYQNERSLAEIEGIVGQAEFLPKIIEKMTRPAEKTMTWERYRGIFMTDERIAAGVEFWNENETVLNQVSQQTGVSVEAIIGIIGVETYYGQRMGTYRVLDALYTLAFGYPRRSSFFKSELGKFLELCESEGLDPLSIKGSYAGAMGYGQFMPSSYLAYAKSFDSETGADLMNEVNDAIASVANYLKVHRWVEGGQVAIQGVKKENAVTLSKQSVKPSKTISYYSPKGYEPSEPIAPSEYVSLQAMEMKDGSHEHWFTFKNFYVITRYNHSPLYALAVFHVGEAVKKKRTDN